MSKTKTVLVTGANGYIGNAVAKAFVRAGWTTYGLVRRPQAFHSLAADEVIPILGSPADQTFVEKLNEQTPTFDVLVSTSEDLSNYCSHYKDIITLFRKLAQTSNSHNVRPLVLFTSGCKDYGMTALADDPALAPHTETSPLNPHALLVDRATHSLMTFEHTDLFDAVVLRPTTVYGMSSSYYGLFFQEAARAAEKGVLEFAMPPTSIVHGTHVDDCAEAYVALAEHADRAKVSGQCYNISGRRYETLEEIANALVREYHIAGGVKWLTPPEQGERNGATALLTGFSQWVASEKIRRDVGWMDRRKLFSEGIKAYRLAYEAAVHQGHENVEKIKEFVNFAAGVKF